MSTGEIAGDLFVCTWTRNVVKINHNFLSWYSIQSSLENQKGAIAVQSLWQ